MRTAGKIGIALLTVFIALIIVGYLLIHAFINPKRYQEQIKHVFYAKTGQHLVIKGNMLLNFFPWVGLTIKNVEISNPPGIRTQPFASIGTLELRMRVLSLLRGELDLTKVELDKMTVNFVKQADGKTNQQAAVNVLPQKGHGQATVSIPQQQHIQDIKNKEQEKPAQDRFSIDVDEFIVSNANINWYDENTKKTLHLQDVNLTATNVGSDKPGVFKANFKSSMNNPNFAVQVQLKSVYRLQNQVIQILQSDIIGKLQFNNDQMPFTFQDKNAAINLEQQKLAFTNAKLNIGNLQTRITVMGTHIFDDAKYQGVANIAMPSSQLKSDITFNCSNKAWQLTPINLQLGPDKLQGKIIAKWLPVLNTSIQIDADKLNLDLLPKSKGATSFSLAPLAVLAVANPNGSINIKQLTYNGQTFNGTTLQFASKGKQFNMPDFHTAVGNAKVNGHVLLDREAKTPLLKAGLTLSDFDIGPYSKMIRDHFKLQMTGILTGEVNATSSGDTADTLRQNLQAQGKFALKNGALIGLHLNPLVSQMRSLQKLDGKASNIKGTLTYDQITGSFAIAKAILTNNDLQIMGNDIKGSGYGTINLADNTLNYNLKLQLANDVLPINMPLALKLTGPVTAPSTRLNVAAMGTHLLGNDILQQLQRHLKR